MSRIGLSEEQLVVAERARDAAMIDHALDRLDRLEPEEVNSLNRHRGRLAIRHDLTKSQRNWLEGIVARLGLARDIGLVEDYAVRTYAPPATKMDEYWQMGAKVTRPPGRRA